jgi:hypothetical protein
MVKGNSDYVENVNRVDAPDVTSLKGNIKLISKPGVSNSKFSEGHIPKNKCFAGHSSIEKSFCGPQFAIYKKSPQNKLNFVKIYNFVIFWYIRGPRVWDPCSKLSFITNDYKSAGWKKSKATYLLHIFQSQTLCIIIYIKVKLLVKILIRL